MRRMAITRKAAWASGRMASKEGKLREAPPGSYLPSSGRHGDHTPASPLVILAEKGQSLARLAGEAGSFPEKGEGLGGRAGENVLKGARSQVAMSGLSTRYPRGQKTDFSAPGPRANMLPEPEAQLGSEMQIISLWLSALDRSPEVPQWQARGHRGGFPKGGLSEWLETTAFTASGPVDIQRCPGILGGGKAERAPSSPRPSLGAPEVLLWGCGDELPGGGTLALP